MNFATRRTFMFAAALLFVFLLLSFFFSSSSPNSKSTSDQSSLDDFGQFKDAEKRFGSSEFASLLSVGLLPRTSHNNDTAFKSNIKIYKISKSIVKSLAEVLEEVDSAHFFIHQSTIEPLSPSMLKTAFQYLRTYPIAKVIGLGTQQSLRLQKSDSVLWIVERDRPTDGSSCIQTDLLETGFIIETKLLKSLVKQMAPSDTLLELFWKLNEARELVLSCELDNTRTETPPIPDYASSSVDMQITNQLLDVIDQRTDTYKRKIGGIPKMYCNTTRSKLWHAKYPPKTEPAAQVTNPYQTLSNWKKVLDELNLPLIPYAGTLLGWYRQCNFIPYTTDLDTTLPHFMYTPKLETVAAKYGFNVKHEFGKADYADTTGGHELTFEETSSKNLLDVFFNYQDLDGKTWTSVWPGELHRIYYRSTSLRELVNADFLGLDVRVPIYIEQTLRSHYGPTWNEPIKQWYWSSSSFNQVKPPHKPFPQINFVNYIDKPQ